jgi:hypothetical protein
MIRAGGCEVFGATRKLLCVAVIAAGVLSGCGVAAGPAPTAAECGPLADPREALAQAWQAYRPDQPFAFSVAIRRRLFALQVLLISTGTYGDPPSDPATVTAQYAPQFVRDLGMARNPGLAGALANFSDTLQQSRERSEGELASNCGLILGRRMLRDDPVNVSTDWVLQTVTWGFAPTFQESIHQMVHDHAQACSNAPDVEGVAESVLGCTMRRVGL